MREGTVKVISLIAAIMFLLTSFSGCSKKEAPVDQGKTPVDTQAESKAKDSTSSGEDKQVTLTYWVELNGEVSAHTANLGDTELYKELEKRTGVKIVFKHPTAGQANEQFNLMVASNDYPDMIEYNFLRYAGGPEKAILDGVIIKLNDILDKSAPNLKAVLNSNKEFDKMVKTDSGSYYIFPFLRGDKWLCTYMGVMLRKDWLQELGLEVPETIDEYINVLSAFKEKKGAQAPLLFTEGSLRKTSFFAGAYGIKAGYYQEDGKVKFGPIEPGYKEYVALMNKLYSQKLIDPDFASLTGTVVAQKVTGGNAGGLIGYGGSDMGRYTKLMRETNPDFALVAGPYPTLKKGDTPRIGQMDNPYSGGGVSISTKCKEKEAAAKWLDYAYGEEGKMLFNFGIENVSYKMENGYPKYTELITNNPDKLSMTQAMGKYMRSSYSGPFVQDRREYEQVLQYPEQKDAITIWSAPENSIHLPPITPSPEESKKITSVQTDVDTYVNEMFLKFVMGQEALSNFDKYVEQVKNMGIQEAIDIHQAALDRYNKR